MSPDHEFDEIREIVDEFMIEAEELVSNLDRDLVEIERTPDDPELLNSIFRSAHTLKGTSGFLGFANLSNLTHNMEDVLNKLRKCELRLNADMIDVLLECVDTIRRMLDDIGSTGAETESDIADVVARLKAAERGVESSVADRRNAPRTKGKSESEKGNEAELKSRSPRTNSVERLVSQESDATGQESSVGGGSNTAVDNPDSISNQDMKAAASSSDYTARDGRREFMDRRRTDPTIRVDVQRLDSLMNMVGELVLGRNALAQVERDISSRLEGSREKEKLTQTTNQVSFITTELQMAVMKLRMLPI
jgi:two-component system chemotaxis sensor kinase CheA